MQHLQNTDQHFSLICVNLAYPTLPIADRRPTIADPQLSANQLTKPFLSQFSMRAFGIIALLPKFAKLFSKFCHATPTLHPFQDLQQLLMFFTFCHPIGIFSKRRGKWGVVDGLRPSTTPHTPIY